MTSLEKYINLPLLSSVVISTVLVLATPSVVCSPMTGASVEVVVMPVIITDK